MIWLYLSHKLEALLQFPPPFHCWGTPGCFWKSRGRQLKSAARTGTQAVG